MCILSFTQTLGCLLQVHKRGAVIQVKVLGVMCLIDEGKQTTVENLFVQDKYFCEIFELHSFLL